MAARTTALFAAAVLTAAVASACRCRMTCVDDLTCFPDSIIVEFVADAGADEMLEAIERLPEEVEEVESVVEAFSILDVWYGVYFSCSGRAIEKVRDYFDGLSIVAGTYANRVVCTEPDPSEPPTPCLIDPQEDVQDPRCYGW